MPNSIEYYLSKGCDRATAEYYASGRKRIVAVSPNEDFTLTLDFDNGERRILDCKSIFIGAAFDPASDYEIFRRVYLDEFHCVSWDIDPNVDSNAVWNNKIDLSPDSCYMDSKPYNKAG